MCFITRGVESLVTKFEALLKVTGIFRIVVTTEEGRIAFKIRRLLVFYLYD
jgi:hypothetical protein